MTATFPIPALTCNTALQRAKRSFSKARRSQAVAQETFTAVREATQENLTGLLLSVAQRRDVTAFESLFKYYAPRVRALMLRQTRDSSLAEELMQEAMITVWNKADLFHPERGTVDAWVFTIARNLKISAFRRANRPAFDPNDPVFVPDEPPEPMAELQRFDDAERLHAAMQGLPPEQLEVLKYAFFDEVSHRKLAEQMNLPVGTIKSRIRMAFGKLRKALEDAE